MSLRNSRSRKDTRLIDWEDKYYKEARAKGEKMTTNAIISWFDTALIGLGKATMDYSKFGMIESVDEIRRCLSQMQALVEQIYLRDEDFSRVP